MPTQPPPLDRTRAAGVPPLYLTLTEVADTPKTKKRKTNPIPQAQQPKNTKRTQSHKANTQKIETNPICRTPARTTTQMRKTNPISAPSDLATLAAGQSRCTSGNPISYRGLPQKCETNPIYPTADLSPSRPTTQLRETNPIPRATTTPTTKKHETNPISSPDYRKRTQSRPSATPKRTKRTQSTVADYPTSSEFIVALGRAINCLHPEMRRGNPDRRQDTSTYGGPVIPGFRGKTGI